MWSVGTPSRRNLRGRRKTSLRDSRPWPERRRSLSWLRMPSDLHLMPEPERPDVRASVLSRIWEGMAVDPDYEVVNLRDKSVFNHDIIFTNLLCSGLKPIAGGQRDEITAILFFYIYCILSGTPPVSRFSLLSNLPNYHSRLAGISRME